MVICYVLSATRTYKFSGSSYHITNVEEDTSKIHYSYRYGFNGQERDDEIYGAGNTYTAEFWEYDARLGRRWNIDPAFKKYSSMSPYSAMFNNPIYFSDPNGDDPDPNKGGEKVERLSLKDRVANWLKADGFKNNVNKRAVKEGVLKSDYKENSDGSITYQTRRTLETVGFLKDDNGYILEGGGTYLKNVDEVITKTFTEGGEITELAYLAGTTLLIPEGTSKIVTTGAFFSIVGTVLLKQIEVPVPDIRVDIFDVSDIETPSFLEAKGKKGKESARQQKVKHGSNPEGQTGKGASWNTHSKPRPGRLSEKKRQKNGWTPNNNKK